MITALERYILESIVKGNNTRTLIHLDTSLEPTVVNKVVQALTSKGLINEQECSIVIKTDELKLKLKRSQEQRALELGQIIRSSIKNSCLENKNDEFSFEKVSLSAKDHTVFKGMLKSLEIFLKGASNSKGKTSHETLVYWGSKPYKSIIDDLYGLNDTNLVT